MLQLNFVVLKSLLLWMFVLIVVSVSCRI